MLVFDVSKSVLDVWQEGEVAIGHRQGPLAGLKAENRSRRKTEPHSLQLGIISRKMEKQAIVCSKLGRSPRRKSRVALTDLVVHLQVPVE